MGKPENPDTHEIRGMVAALQEMSRGARAGNAILETMTGDTGKRARGASTPIEEATRAADRITWGAETRTPLDEK